jgi:hypothetical protein
MFIEEIKRILKPKGRVLLVDWKGESVLGQKVTLLKEKSLEIFEKAGFKLDREIDAGNHHYGIILSRQP